jgi:TolB-like protein/predicted Zn-dependent protease
VVYRAHQKSLNRTVALKVIGLGLFTTEAHLKRFRREAEAAARLEHPCIVPIYEVGERDGQCYFTMKFVEGGQLDEVVRRAPMSIRQAAELIAKVARTVHYAHEHGILHRDIKPGNILLDQKGEPHLTDFGLARLLETESTVTRTLEVMGTPSYMAPEQAVGNNALVSSATDVYGLGTVLYQLLTGHPPFAGGTTYETIKLLLDTELRPPRSLNPKIDRELSTICLKCLEKDPQRRYSSALALAEDLEHWLKHEPIRAKPSGFLTHSRKWVRRNPSTTVLVTLLVALAVGLSVTVWNRKPTVIIPKSVAVLPFENLSDDPNNAYFAEGIQEEILTRLAGIADLKVISRTSTQRYHSRPGNLAEIAKQLGVANILEGSVQKAADQVRVNVQLINAQTDSHLWADSYDRKLTNVLGVESEIAKGVTESLQVKLTGREERALAVKPTNNPEAYDAYLRGVAFEGRSLPSVWSPDLEAKAIGFFERAVQLDPNFALSWARLCRADAYFYFVVGDTGDVSPAARRDAAKRALENAQKLEPNSPETLLALGYYRYHVLRDYRLAETTFELVRKALPSSSEGPYALALIARRVGHWDQSIAYFEQALVLDPRNMELLMVAAETYASLRQFPAALRLCDRVLDITPNDPDVMSRKADIYQALGNLQEAARFLSQIDEQAPNEDAFLVKITQLRLERNYGEAVRLLQAREAQFHFGSQFDKAPDQVLLALTQRLAGDAAGARATAELARTTLEQFYKDQPNNVWAAVWLSRAYATMGEKHSALKEAERAITLLPSTKDRLWGPSLEENLALIQTTFGENTRAISTLTQLLKTPFTNSLHEPVNITPALLRLDPIWDPLRADPAFQKLCEEKIDKSIAVLPFENLSHDPDNAYFAEGIQEEILTRLAKIADLKVISRTSTQRYQSKPADLSEIAKQLGVANILEGSVQKAANQVRVNVQLINAQADSHLWADTFDRKLTDIFEVESEIAKAIAGTLQAKLTGRDEQGLAVKPTNNPEAYDAYLRGLSIERNRYSNTNYQDAAKAYARATQLDPTFAIAWARLAVIRSFLYFNSVNREVNTPKAVQEAADRAMALAPEAGESWTAKGAYHYRILRDFEGAVAAYQEAQKRLPNNSFVLQNLALVQRRVGRWQDAEASFTKALAVDPLDVSLLSVMGGEFYCYLRRFDQALALFDRELAIAPDSETVHSDKARVLQDEGRLAEAAQELAHIAEDSTDDFVVASRVSQALYEHDFNGVIRVVERKLNAIPPGQALDSNTKIGLAQLGYCQEWTGRRADAQQSFNRAIASIKPTAYTVVAPYAGKLPLALAYAGLGQKQEALEQAQQAVKDFETDAVSKPRAEIVLAQIQARFGDHDAAIAALPHLLEVPAGITTADLKFNPFWDPLRSDPRFQKLCEEKQQ